MRIARRQGREIDRAAAPGSVRAATSGPFLPRPGFKIFIYAFCALDTIACRTRAPPPCAPQAARRAVRTPAAGRQPPAGPFPCRGAFPSDIQHDTHPSPASLHPPSSFLSRHRTQGVLPLGRRTSPPGSPGAGISCSYVAFCLPLPPEHYLSRQESYRPPPPLYPLSLPTPHGTRQPPRHSRHASARPRPGTPPPASGHRRASPLAKVCGRGGEGAPAGRHTGRRTGRKVIAFRERGLGWRRKARCGMPPRGKGEPRKGRPDRDKQKEGQPGLLLFVRGRARLHALVPKGRRPPRSAPIGHQRPLPRA